ncbi:hypothetical protein GCK72_016711 [Caenorhabditis remanei]|uniref:Uncharacterized protein n=1 Tax=Caenorhabditis remanei TaxID=31234 RepID=A0A6A5G6F3_CAERE|nr:hypothetical protein GCK72_016711 [Caenorhabditis remanei]KAF1750164.1 hypothetical protein GCK72_016711 [Caenorhabditis remanei]
MVAIDRMFERTQESLDDLEEVGTIVPVVTMYIPVGLFIALPFFNIGLGSFVNYPSGSMALYPCIEPLIAIWCIKDFRMVVIKLLPRCKTQVTETVRSVYSSNGTKTIVQ